MSKGVSNSGRGAGELGSGPGLCHWSCEDRKIIFFSLKEVTSYLVGSKCASTLILGRYKKNIYLLEHLRPVLVPQRRQNLIFELSNLDLVNELVSKVFFSGFRSCCLIFCFVCSRND